MDLRANHGREFSRCLIQDAPDAVSVAAIVKQEDWSYALTRFDSPPAELGSQPGGACAYGRGDGWREAMVGTLAFYDAEGQRQHTVYVAATPGYGKAKILGHLDLEIEQAVAVVLSLQVLSCAPRRLDEFWSKVDW